MTFAFAIQSSAPNANIGNAVMAIAAAATAAMIFLKIFIDLPSFVINYCISLRNVLKFYYTHTHEKSI